MEKISSADDVYKNQVAESDFHWDEGEDWLLGIISFATIEEDRIDWSKHFEETHNRPPTPEEVAGWYEGLTEGRLQKSRNSAENNLVLYAQEIEKEFDNDARRAAEEGVIVSEIRSASRFGKQVWASVFGGLLAALIFGAVITIVYFIANENVSPVDATKSVVEQFNEGEDDGKATGQQGSNQ